MMKPTNFIESKPVGGYLLLETYTPNSDQRVSFYISNDGTLVIGFYGTLVTFSDWWNNFELETIIFSIKNIIYRGTKGVVEEVNDLLPKIMAQIIITNPNKIILVGHSQGGAHTEIIFAHLISKLNLPIEGITYESICGLTKDSSKQIALSLRDRPDCSFTRYMVNGDLIDLIPYGLIGLGHFSPKIILEKGPLRIPSWKYHMLEYIKKIDNPKL